jgi:hypothetical protein
MRKLWLVPLLFVFSSAFASARTWPQLALGGGYKAIILISNKLGTDWSGQFFPNQGHKKSWAGTWRVNGQDYTGQAYFNLALHGNETAKIVLSGDDASPTQTGYLFMWGTGSSSAYDVSISYFYAYYQNSKLITSTGSIEEAPHKVFQCPVEYTPTTASVGVDIGIAWAPEYSNTPETFNMSATLYLTDKSGAVQLYGTKTLPYSGHAAQFIDEIFPELHGTEFKGYLQIAAEYEIFLEVIRMDSVDNGILLTATRPDWSTP